MGKNNCIVVGGGLVGLFSSILLADRFSSVTLIERAPHLGGLLRSSNDSNGACFDLGTHVPNFTLKPEVDEILFGTKEEIEQNWTIFEYIYPAAYSAGKWNPETSIMDARHLDEPLYEKAVEELLERSSESQATNLAEHVLETFGPTLCENLFAPLVRKLYGVEAQELVTSSSVSYFGLTKIVAFERERTQELMQNEVFAAKLGYTTHDDYNTSRNDRFRDYYLYPKGRNGVGFWMKRLEQLAQEKGVRICLNEFVSSLESKDGSVTSVQLGESKETLPCDFVAWTAPPAFALQAAGVPVGPPKSIFRTASVFHYSFDKPLLNKRSAYIWNWDPSFLSFRVTLYPNIDPQAENDYSLTAEVLSSPEEADGISLEQIHEELVRCELVDPAAQVRTQSKVVIHNTFPAPTEAHHAEVKTQNELLSNHFDNIRVLGRFAGKAWFHKDVLLEAWGALTEFPKISGD